MLDDKRFPLHENEQPSWEAVRFRTLGCYPLTAAIHSSARNVEEIIVELFAMNTSERQGRLIDSDVPAAMEKKKKEGYF
jgi:sulfate adenylyltransferase subunit 2